jgi:hypothetical protein
MVDAIKTPGDVYARLFEEVGIEHRGTIQQVLDEHMSDPVMTTGSIDDGLTYIANLARERLGKSASYTPQAKEPKPFEDGFKYPTNQDKPQPESSFLDSIRARRAQRRGR